MTVLYFSDDAYRELIKAQKAEIFTFTRENNQEYSEFYLTSDDFKSCKKITETNPQQKDYYWSSGRRIIDYVTEYGDSLQGVLYLPANHKEGQVYPTIVYMYEKLSHQANSYLMPRLAGVLNISFYTSHGYAVFTPDIVFKINDPGVSSTKCILAGIEAALKTGLVDPDRLGIQGHSWGGYQTAFMITQTDIFKAACAGAPLTNMLSMYSSIYWNTGGANMAIFESSQGRFLGGYWDNLEAYTRNSPVYLARNVNTPLLMLHNDKDGAVDWNQGIEYYNTLRRLNKPVVMLEYKGENHGLRQLENKKDYTLRMKEFFDYYLKDGEVPEWWKKGVPYINLQDHLKERSALLEPPQPCEVDSMKQENSNQK
ncbi:MAG: S9 family peptidase [Candidatus Marinimicrobia bacterium]|nr:S9 family peptidase [Candidatus Neomarinimicrobiota bacterium]